MMEAYLVITFDSTHVAMDTERLLSDFDIEMIPTPRQITTNCGLSIRGQANDVEAIKKIITAHHKDMSHCYLVSKDDGVLTFKKV